MAHWIIFLFFIGDDFLFSWFENRNSSILEIWYVTQIPEKLDLFVGKRFIFKINVDSRNVKGVSYVYLVTRMMEDSELSTPRGLSYETSRSNDRELDTTSTMDSSKVHAVSLYLFLFLFILTQGIN